jgi:hypothetical protein
MFCYSALGCRHAKLCLCCVFRQLVPMAQSVLTLQVTKVSEPSAYGVVVTKPNSTVIDRFVEKPVEFVGNRINAGIYMFNPSVLDRIEVGCFAFRSVSSSRYYRVACIIAEPDVPRLIARSRLETNRISFAPLLSRRKFSLLSLPINNCTPLISPDSGWTLDSQRTFCLVSGLDSLVTTRTSLTHPGTCLYLSHLTSQHSPLLSDPTKNKWVYGGNVLVDPVSRVAG